MKNRSWVLISMLIGLLVLAACRSAHTQTAPQPQVITTQDEVKHSAEFNFDAPATGDSTPAISMPASASPAAAAKLTYNSCNVDGQIIAITFDDGPKPGQTDRLLDILKARGIKATFFVIGQNAAAYPELIRRIVAEGHEIGNHTWSHPALSKLSAAAVESQMRQTDAAIIQAGAQKPTLMRPPYGATNTSLNHRINEVFGQKVIMWDVDPLDWKVRNSAHVANEILKHTKPGSIILAHDIHASTVDAMPETLDSLQQKGFKFVTVSELIALDRPQLVKKEPGSGGTR